MEKAKLEQNQTNKKEITDTIKKLKELQENSTKNNFDTIDNQITDI